MKTSRFFLKKDGKRIEVSENEFNAVSFGLGDAVAALANPIARASDAIFGTSLVGCSSCAERQAALNKLLPNLGKSPKSDAQ
jgi:hypothetical protein